MKYSRTYPNITQFHKQGIKPYDRITRTAFDTFLDCLNIAIAGIIGAGIFYLLFINL